MCADPEPEQAVGCFYGECAIVQADTRRQETIELLEVERRVLGFSLRREKDLSASF
jgi:hypothetical protein